MSGQIFPSTIRGLDVNVTKAPTFSTLVQEAPSGYTTRLAQMQNPIWKFWLTWNYLKDNPKDIPVGLTYTDLQTMMGFYMARQGQYDDFLYDDPSDDYVGPALNTDMTPNTQAELQVVTDGTYYYSPIQRNMGGQFYEDITDLNGGIQVYADGVAKSSPTNYTVLGPGLAIPGYSFAGLYLKWAITSPVGPPASPVTAQFNFYFRVRFDTDQREFDQFINGVRVWCIGGPYATNSQYLTLTTARPPTP
jgi:hypothetical protein